MNNEKLTFGEFIRAKRVEHGLSLRKMAETMNFSPTYWSDIENGRRNPPSIEKLRNICEALSLNSSEQDLLFDLAGEFEQIPPPDLTEYLQDPSVRRALRTAKNHNIEPKTWEDFEQSIIKKHSK